MADPLLTIEDVTAPDPVLPRVGEAIHVARAVLAADRDLQARLGGSVVTLDRVALQAGPGEDAATLGRRLAAVVRGQALAQLKHAERALAEVVAGEVKQEALAAAQGKVRADGLAARIGRGALRLFRFSTTGGTLALSPEQQRQVEQTLAAANAAKAAVQARFAQATGYSVADVTRLVHERGAHVALDAVCDRLIASSGASFSSFERDPQGFYERNGAAVTGRVMRQGMLQRGRGDADQDPRAFEAFAREYGFAAVSHLATDRVVDMITTGTMLPGKHSGNYLWFGQRHLTGAPTIAQRMSTTFGLAAVSMASKLKHAINFVVPAKQVLGPGQAIENRVDTRLNRGLYKAKGAVQQGWATGLGYKAGAIEGNLRLLPQGVGMNPAEVEAISALIGGGVNSRQNQVVQLAVLTGLLATFGALLLL